ncbi:hypothetical protein B0H15DRAFT_958582, partial [Mycena belliarum]
MPATLTATLAKPKKIPILRPSPTKTPPRMRKPTPAWVDVSDAEDRIGGKRRRWRGREAAAPSQDGTANGASKRPGPQATSTPPRKKARLSGPAPAPAVSSIQEQRRLLPIAKGREALVAEIRANEVTVLLGETGSGKTTRGGPQYLLEAGLAGAAGLIGITQPRRVAALSLAARVALEQGAP